MNLTETPKKARYRHRLYVVLPLFLVLATAGIGGHSTASVAPALSYTQSGSMIAGKSLIRFDIDKYRVSAWNGALVVDPLKNGRFTVAALTTPVLVQHEGESWLVPVGTQMLIKASTDASPEAIASWVKTRRPLPLPAHYLREILPEAEVQLARASIQPLAAPETLLPPLAGSALMFDEARSDAERDARAQRVSGLFHALSQHDLKTFDALMSMTDTRDILDHADSDELATLLTLSLDNKRDVQILPSILNNPTLSLLLRFHPLLRNRVWLTHEASADRSLLLLGQMLLPFSDYSESSVSQQSIQSWEAGWKTLQADASTLNVIVPLVAKDIAALDAEGYPIRARAYAAAFVSGVHPLPDGVSDEAQAALDHLRSIYDIVLSVADPSPLETEEENISVSSVASSVSSIATIVLEADVRAMLSAHGCMFTSKSVLRLLTGGLYQVQDIVIGTPLGDRMISFTFNPGANTVMDIEQNGQILPYSLSLEKYLEWVKAGN